MCVRLGRAFYDGEGVTPNVGRSREYLKMASDNGDELATKLLLVRVALFNFDAVVLFVVSEFGLRWFMSACR